MIRFFIRRVLRGVLSLVLFQVLLFTLITHLPYNIVTLASVAGGRDFGQFIAKLYGLDRPFWQQLLDWLAGFFTLDLGQSFQFYPATVSEVLLSRASRTLLLFLTAALLAYVIGIWLGKVIAWNRGGWIEAGASLGGVAAFTSFAPWLGFLALQVFAWYLRWFPYQRLVDHNVWFGAPVSVESLFSRMVLTGGLAFGAVLLIRRLGGLIESRAQRLALKIGGAALIIVVGWAWWAQSGLSYLAVDVLRHLVVPLGTVTLLSFGDTMMLMRMAMIETNQEDFVLTARAKGIPPKAIRDHHVARNALFPVLTRLLLNLPFVLIGSFVMELVFNWRGVGVMLFQAIEVVDVPIIMGILSFVGVITLLAHIVLDVIYVYLDPRLRYAAHS